MVATDGADMEDMGVAMEVTDGADSDMDMDMAMVMGTTRNLTFTTQRRATTKPYVKNPFIYRSDKRVSFWCLSQLVHAHTHKDGTYIGF